MIPLDAPTNALVAAHAERFEPTYGGFLSDHLPMTAMALWSLQRTGGVTEADAADRVATYMQQYGARLDAIDPEGAFASEHARFQQIIDFRGVADTLHEHLPRLISGWVRDAYHPLIRLAYGIDFGVPGEVAAGLAYLSCCGPDPTLHALARSARQSSRTALELLGELSASRPPVWPPGVTFTDHANATIAGGLLPRDVLLPDNVRAISEAALAAFDATHNFFALHLVTGCHAFRICQPYAGELGDALLTLGVLTGYLAIGAPTVPELTTAGDTPDAARLLALASDDEHDLKLAHTVMEEAAHWRRPQALSVAARYFTRGTLNA